MSWPDECPWCHELFIDEKRVSHDKMFFHPECLEPYLLYLQAVKESGDEERRRSQETFVSGHS